MPDIGQDSKIMKILFRCDYGSYVGSGHLHRCLSLANELAKFGHQSFLALRCHSKEKINFDSHSELQVFHLQDLGSGNLTNPNDHLQWLGVPEEDDFLEVKNLTNSVFDFIVVDHYSITNKWHQLAKSITKKIVVIDDLADKEYDCDFIINSNFGFQESEYRGKTNASCNFLLGSKFVPLRADFSFWRSQSIISGPHSPLKVLCYLGGATTSENVNALCTALCSFDKKFELTFLNSGLTEAEKKNYQQCSRDQIRFKEDISNMAEYISGFDLGIGAAGISTWERSCIKRPSLLFKLAENQEVVVRQIRKDKPLVVFGKKELQNTSFLKSLSLFYQADFYNEMATYFSQFTHGLGTPSTLFKIFDICPYFLSNASNEYCEILYQWQTQATTRKFARNPNSPSWEEHQSWYQQYLKNTTGKMFFLCYEKTPLGMVRVDQKNSKNEVSILISADFYGAGLGEIALNLVKKEFPYTTLHAEIDPQNIYSKKIFINTGFEPLNEKEYIYQGSSQ